VLPAALTAGVLAIAGCGGDGDKTSSKPATTGTATATGPSATRPPGKRTTPTTERLTPNPKRAGVERTIARFVEGLERSDAASVCRLLGRPPGTLERCAEAAGVDLHAVPSSDELSVARISFRGSRASAKLAGGQTLTLRRAGRGWLITGLRP
jgi:hypothetical protein